jgi:copper(I)-binding protein
MNPLRRRRSRSLAWVCWLAAVSAWPASADVTVQHAWVRATVPGQRVAGAYMDIATTRDARLVAVHSPLAAYVDIHLMQMDGAVMRMREVATLELPRNRVTTLQPGGYHLMLTQLKTPIHVGDIVPLTLTIVSDGHRELLKIKAVARGTR